MNIIELAREAGAYTDCIGEHTITSDASIERFAALVRAAALEEAALKCDDLWQDDGTAYDCREAILALAKEKT